MNQLRPTSCAWIIAIVLAPALLTAMPIRDRDHTPPEWESYGVLIRKVEDTDKITLEIAKKEHVIVLSNVLPLAKWPADDESKKFKVEAMKYLKQKLEGKKLFYYRGHLLRDKSDILRGDLVRSHDGGDWPGGTPASIGWGITFVNAHIIQDGMSVYLPDDTFVLGPPNSSDAHHDQRRKKNLKDAEEWAEKNGKGIWQNREFARRLRAAAMQAGKKK